MKNALSVTLKALFVLKMFKFLSSAFGHVERRLDLNDKVNGEIYDVNFPQFQEVKAKRQ